MLWTPSQKVLIDNFINRIKTVEWFKHAGEPSEKYWVVDTIWEACDTHGRKTREVWEKNSEILEQKALQKLSDEQIDFIFETVSLAIGNQVDEALCAFEDRIGQETGEDQSGIEDEILDFIKRDTAWACVELLMNEKGFFSRICQINENTPREILSSCKFPRSYLSYAISIPAATSRAVSSERKWARTVNPNCTAKPGPLPVMTFPSTTTPSPEH